MQGVFVSSVRPKTKKALREAVRETPELVALEATSMFGDEYGGPLTEAPRGSYYIAGPNPHTDRRWYATIAVTSKGVSVQ